MNFTRDVRDQRLAMAQIAEIKRRVGDYDENNFLKERERLIAAWRAAHPEAANQPPSAGHRHLVFELYPAEARLLDPSNYYTLWCFPGVKRIKVGLEERRVWDASEAWAPQRGFSE